MTLGGLALAVGILVDEATVVIENLHTHFARGESRGRAVLLAARETLVPRLLAMLAVLAVFVPSFFMTGIARSLFVPLSLAVGFAMLASYLLSNTLVPVLAATLLSGEQAAARPRGWFERLQHRYAAVVGSIVAHPRTVAAIYTVIVVVAIVGLIRVVGTDMFPEVDTGQLQLRLRAPTGTRIERTEAITLKALEAIRAEAGPGNVDITLAFSGNPTSNYPVNSIHLWSSGPHEALLLVALRPNSGIRLQALKERLRKTLPEVLPDTTISFEAGDVVSQIMNFGAPTPIEVTVSGPDFAADRAFAQRVLAEMRKIPTLRDLQLAQPLDYPTVDIRIDRVRAGQLGVTVDQIGRSLAAATSSSRYVVPNYWRDPVTGIAYQVQVEIPQALIHSVEDIAVVPAMPNGASRPLVGDVASIGLGTMVGEYDRWNQQRMVTIIANVAGTDLGNAAAAVEAAIRRAGEPPRGVEVNVRGQVAPMNQTLAGLQVGLLVAIAVIFLLLAANFQSMRLSAVALSTVPAVLVGVGTALWVWGTTLNVQSFMGAIMALGVSAANAILLVTFAERHRGEGNDAVASATAASRERLRPILMTSLAMIAGMVPVAFALGEGGDQTAPLGRAVIGGLAASTVAVLIVLPAVFTLAQSGASRRSASLHPDDAEAVTEG